MITCEGCKDDPICDFCIFFDRDTWYCSKILKEVDPIYICDHYSCFNAMEAKS